MYYYPGNLGLFENVELSQLNPDFSKKIGLSRLNSNFSNFFGFIRLNPIFLRKKCDEPANPKLFQKNGRVAPAQHEILCEIQDEPVHLDLGGGQIWYVFSISKCRGESGLGMCMTSVLAERM